LRLFDDVARQKGSPMKAHPEAEYALSNG